MAIIRTLMTVSSPAGPKLKYKVTAAILFKPQ